MDPAAARRPENLGPDPVFRSMRPVSPAFASFWRGGRVRSVDWLRRLSAAGYNQRRGLESAPDRGDGPPAARFHVAPHSRPSRHKEPTMSDSLSRRQFLGTTAAAGVLLAGQIGARPLAAAEDERVAQAAAGEDLQGLRRPDRRELSLPAHRGNREIRKVPRRHREEARRREVHRRRSGPSGRSGRGRPASSKRPTP